MTVCPLVAAVASAALFRSCLFYSFGSPLTVLTINQINLFRKIKLDAQFDECVFVLEA